MGTINTNIRIDELEIALDELRKRTEPLVITIAGTASEEELPAGTVESVIAQLRNYAPVSIVFPDLNDRTFSGYMSYIITDTDVMFYMPGDETTRLELSNINDTDWYYLTLD